VGYGWRADVKHLYAQSTRTRSLSQVSGMVDATRFCWPLVRSSPILFGWGGEGECATDGHPPNSNWKIKETKITITVTRHSSEQRTKNSEKKKLIAIDCSQPLLLP